MAEEMVTLERVDEAKVFTWSYGYETYTAENGEIVVPASLAATLATGAQQGVYQVAGKPPAKKKVKPKVEGGE